MKKFTVIVFLLSSLILYAQNNNSIDFARGSFEAILKTAKEQKKLVFVAYENYSGKSRWMEQNVFTNIDVSQFFNQKFINLRINSESMRDKSMFSDFKYRSSSAACFFITPNGEIVHKINSISSPKELITEAHYALKINENFISLDKMDKLFKKGERSTEFLYLYSLRRLQTIDFGDARDRQVKELDRSVRAYMNRLSEEDFATEQNMILACEYLYETNKNCSDELYERMIKNLDLVNEFSEENEAGFRQRLGRIIDRSFNEAVLTNNKTLMHEVVKSVDLAWFEKSTPFYNKENLISSYKIDFYEMTKDWENYKKEVVLYMNRIDAINIKELTQRSIEEYKAYETKLKFSEESWIEFYEEILKSYGDEVAFHLRMYGWRFAQTATEKNDLQACLKWLNKSLRLSPNPIALKTYSNLLFKVGREEDAKKYADLSKKSPTIENYQVILARSMAEDK